MSLKILLPFEVFTEIEDVREISTQTGIGSFGILPQRLDCVAALEPGILKYIEKSGNKIYLAIDEGLLIKTNNEVLVSVRNVVGGADLGKLHETIEKKFKSLDEQEKEVRDVMMRLESGFIHSFEKFREKNRWR